MKLPRTFGYLALCLIAVLTGNRVWAGDDNLKIVFTTTDAGGKYGNRHVHAVWLTTPSGQWVSTVGNIEVQKRAVWANRRASSLKSWWNSNPDHSKDIDARTSATQTAYKTYTLNWDWHTLTGEIVPDGQYKLHFECTNADGGTSRNYTTVSITKGRTPWSLGPLTQGGYRNIALTYSVSELGVDTLTATHITERSAVLNGRISGAQTDEQPHTWFYWGCQDGEDDAGAWEYRLDLGVQSNGAFAASLDHLTRKTTYFYRAAIRSQASTIWAPQTQTLQAQATAILFQEGDIWHYFEGRTAPNPLWNSLEFDDQDWPSGPAGIGYSDGDDQTTISMRDQFITLYMRRVFEIDDPNDVSKLTFTVDYDDGFVAYINGTEVARRGVSAGQTHTTTANNHSASVDGGSVETLDLSLEDEFLQSGDNVFAIEVHNQALNSSDLSMIPTLTVTGGVDSPQPNISANTNQLSFGDVAVGQFKSLNVTLTNQGLQPLVIEAVNIAGLHAKAFSVSSPSEFPVTLAPMQQIQVAVQFIPSVAQTWTYTELLIASNDWDQPVLSIALQGQSH